jgi:hypothetical protein
VRHLASSALLVALSVCLASGVGAEETAARPALSAVRVASPPVIDGVLDDVAWSGAPATTPAGEWKTYNPLHGSTIPQQTRVWLAYDTRYLYFAFDCVDPEPQKIKTSVTRRDDIFGDDWVGLSLDALGTGQTSYHMMVNPNGVQLDMLNSVSGDEDLAPDWIWDSAGNRTPTGYAVEIRLPLQSIRFSGGDRAQMGILFWRRVSRLGMSVAWPALEPGKWVFEKHAALTFRDLRGVRTREVVPAATWTGSQSRETTPDWTGFAGRGDVGVSARMGITSTVTLDGTVNPDFSQVESDAFQVEVNQRFPVFYPEKRPFFMEGADIFKLAGVGNGDSSMYAAVHTRNIVDPIAGAKVTGTLGRFAFGTLSAADEAAGHEVEPGEPGYDRSRVFNIGRVQYSLGAGSNAGAIVTDTRFAGDDNQVVGADLAWRVRGTHRVTVMALQSWSRTPTDDGGADKTSGAAVMAGYGASSRRAQFQTQFEHYDRAFRMDTAFYNRTGFTSGWAYGDLSFYPEKTKTWLLRISPFTFQSGGTDRMAGGDERMNATGIRFSFTRQGFLRVDQLTGIEPWQGDEYSIHRTRAFGSLQPYRWLNVFARVTGGDAIYYDEEEPFAGRSKDLNVEVTFQPTGRFTESLSYTRVAFDRASTGERVYTLDIVNSRATYQFTRELALRGTVRYDGSQRRILTDVLAAWELRPGTLVYAGYGSLSEQRRFVEGEWRTHEGDYLGIRRGLFLKTSYLHRF